MPSLQPVGREPLSDLVIARIKEHIANRDWPVGQALPPESELARQLGVGRSTIRESIRALAHAGILEVRHGDGTYVRAMHEMDVAVARRLAGAHLLEIYEIRRALELEASRLAAARRDESDLAAMAQALRDRAAQREAGNHEAYIDADIRFHLAIVTASRNPVLIDLYTTFMQALRQTMIPLVDLQPTDTAPLHNTLFDAIRESQPDLAVAATAAHLDNTEQALRTYLRPEALQPTSQPKPGQPLSAR